MKFLKGHRNLIRIIKMGSKGLLPMKKDTSLKFTEPGET